MHKSIFPINSADLIDSRSWKNIKRRGRKTRLWKNESRARRLRPRERLRRNVRRIFVLHFPPHLSLFDDTASRSKKAAAPPPEDDDMYASG